MQNMERLIVQATLFVVAQPQGRVVDRALRRPKKPMPVCNAPDMPTSVRSFMARKYVEPPHAGKANDKRRQSLDASRSCRLKNAAARPQTSIAKLPCGVMIRSRMNRIPRDSGKSLTGEIFERLEPCEGKLSRTVLRGVWAG